MEKEIGRALCIKLFSAVFSVRVLKRVSSSFYLGKAIVTLADAFRDESWSRKSSLEELYLKWEPPKEFSSILSLDYGEPVVL